MKNHIEPVAMVKTYMEKTVVSRARWIKENSELTISEIMTQYPRLFDTPGMVSYEILN